jgi:hypothetical protein
VAPEAKQGDIVNSLTNAYCPYVENDQKVPAKMKGPVLDRFAVLVYTQLTNNEKY